MERNEIIITNEMLTPAMEKEIAEEIRGVFELFGVCSQQDDEHIHLRVFRKHAAKAKQHFAATK